MTEGAWEEEQQTDTAEECRRVTLARFSEHVTALFAADPAVQSVLLAVAQYWNDQADDEVHCRVVASERATPAWPHDCRWGEARGDGPPSVPAVRGERCEHCDPTRFLSTHRFTFYGHPVTVMGFEAFCLEDATQHLPAAMAYVPYAVARRAGADVAFEAVGHAQRPPATMIGAGTPSGWPDAQAHALFDAVCRSPDDDGPRWVLADYLRERYPADPRGEAIALALSGSLDLDARARRDALLHEHRVRWMSPVGGVVPSGCAHFERGFVARVDVHASELPPHAPAWGTVREITLLRGSYDVVLPAMVALRQIGPFRDDGLWALATASVSWSIESIAIAGSADLSPLARAANLPRLRRLEIDRAHEEALASWLSTAPWRAQLAELVFVGEDHGSFDHWRALRAQLGLPALGVALRASWADVAASWEVLFLEDGNVAIRQAGYHEQGTLAALAALVEQLHPAAIALRSSRVRVMTEGDAAWLRAQTRRALRVTAG